MGKGIDKYLRIKNNQSIVIFKRLIIDIWKKYDENNYVKSSCINLPVNNTHEFLHRNTLLSES